MAMLGVSLRHLAIVTSVFIQAITEDIMSNLIQSQPRLHATGFMTTEVTDTDLRPLDLAAIRARCQQSDITSTS